MIGAIFGDIVGSLYEFDNIKTKDFPLFAYGADFTDDSVMTLAVADALMQCGREADRECFRRTLIRTMHDYGKAYPDVGYGGRFLSWVLDEERSEPYNSCGNGSAMRVSAVGWYADTLGKTLELAEVSAAVTHNHPEGVKGAVVTAGAIFLARTGSSREEIRDFVTQYYTLDFTLEEIRPTYTFTELCQDTVPQAMQAFFESKNFEDAVRLAVSLGGDSDTLAAITGSVAEAFYGMSEEECETALSYLPPDLLETATNFRDRYLPH